MKKITFVLGAAVGFVLGSKTGTGPYQQLEAKVRDVTQRPKPGAGETVQRSQPAAAGDKAAGAESASSDQTVTETLIPSTTSQPAQPII